MKRWTRVVLAMLCAFILTPVPAGAKVDPKAAAEAELKAKREKEAAALLNGTVWNVEMVPLSGEKGKKPLADTLTFEGGKINSKSLSKEGYATSNYTLTVEVGDLVIWETMQSKEGTGVVFWRGERQGDTMRGILSKQPTDGKNVDYSFSGKVLSPAAPPASPAVVPEAPPVAPSPAVTDPASQHSMTASAPAAEQPVALPAAPARAAPETKAAAPAPAQPPAAPKKKKGWW